MHIRTSQAHRTGWLRKLAPTREGSTTATWLENNRCDGPTKSFNRGKTLTMAQSEREGQKLYQTTFGHRPLGWSECFLQWRLDNREGSFDQNRQDLSNVEYSNSDKHWTRNWDDYVWYGRRMSQACREILRLSSETRVVQQAGITRGQTIKVPSNFTATLRANSNGCWD